MIQFIEFIEFIEFIQFIGGLMDEELDKELDEIVRSAYHRVNQDYLRQQAINALVAIGMDREEAEAWLNQCEISVNG